MSSLASSGGNGRECFQGCCPGGRVATARTHARTHTLKGTHTQFYPNKLPRRPEAVETIVLSSRIYFPGCTQTAFASFQSRLCVSGPRPYHNQDGKHFYLWELEVRMECFETISRFLICCKCNCKKSRTLDLIMEIVEGNLSPSVSHALPL